ncbi:ATP-binding protein [Clostridium sp. JS66]|uniref:ATP-binding protein n=1 Tax=Clostridium sp. JS66 TaxID=3064705 RepID=UPI00298E306E|nr:ATP-binding protein [Clostridium sp. JS66]WPC44201.1 ATP-binding protein [Clostridium sp. JS66]
MKQWWQIVTKVLFLFRKKEEKLDRSADFYLNLFDNIPGMVWRKNSKLECDYYNSKFVNFVGKESLNNEVKNFKHLIHKDDLNMYNDITNHNFKLRKSFQIEYRLRRHDGEYRWMIDRRSVINDMEGNFIGYVGVSNDVTDKKIAEEKYKSLFYNMSDAFVYSKIIKDENDRAIDFKIVEANSAFEKLFNLKCKDICGKSCSEVFPNMSMLFLEKLKDLNSSSGRFDNIHLNEFYYDKNSKWLSISAFEAEKGYIGTIITDVTEIKNSELKLKVAMDEAQAANKAKSMFLATMSHEIRTPLNGMLGMIDLTLRSKLGKEQVENLKVAKESAKTLLRVINDVLDISKIEAGKLNIWSSEFNFYEIMENIIKTYSVFAQDKGIQIDCSIDKEVPKILIGDFGRLRQVIENLVSNAIKFTDKGSVSISVKKLNHIDNDIELVFYIKDTGIGISEDENSLLFKSFSQIDGSYTRQFNGTGLGLVISKELVEKMNGSISVKSEKGKGSTFSFTCKLKIANKQSNKLGLSSKISSSKGILRILLVDDDKVNQLVISKILENTKHTFTICNNGKEALDYLEKEQFDIIFMDIQMPVKDGVSTTRIIRERGKFTGVQPVIVAITAYALNGDKEKFLKLGMNEYLSKPIDIDEFYFILNKYSKKKAEKCILDSIKDNSKISIFKGKPNINDYFNIAEKLEKLEFNLKARNISCIEQYSREIKELGEAIEDKKIKQLAFRMELAARRGDYSELNLIIPELKIRTHNFTGN